MHLLGLVVVLCVCIVVNQTRDIALGVQLILLDATFVVAALFATGGWEMTGYLWPFAYLPYASFLTTKKQAWFWLGLLFFACLAIVLLGSVGLTHVPYSDVQLGNFFGAFVLFAFCILFFKAKAEKNELLLVSNQRELLMRANELERLNKLQSEIDQAKSEFVSLASHQLRTPSSAIRWNVELMQETQATLGSEQREMLRRIYESDIRMINLIDSLLNISRMEIGAFVVELTQVNVQEVIRFAVQDTLRDIQENKIVVKITDHMFTQTALLDRTFFIIVLQNLMKNAIMYNKPGGSVEIITSTSDTDFLLTIADTGYGIPKYQQHKVFTKLFRADNIRKVDANGAGLGLYLVKTILDHTHGRVWFESAEDRGSTFYVAIPLGGMSK